MSDLFVSNGGGRLKQPSLVKTKRQFNGAKCMDIFSRLFTERIGRSGVGHVSFQIDMLAQTGNSMEV